MFDFPISGVETYWWLPTLVAFGISAITSTGGVTGAFILLPFTVSVLGYNTPGVSPTNLLYNVVAIPSGVWRFHRERRMLWSLAWATILATLPGQTIGAIIRLKYLPDARSFKLFAGFVLLYLGGKLVQDLLKRRSVDSNSSNSAGHREITAQHFDLSRISYDYDGNSYAITTWPVILISFVVGIVGGIYGIGGGALLSPYFVAIYQLPVHSIAGAMLLGTFVSSVAGVIVYMIVSPFFTPEAAIIMPDWLLGLAFGVGGAMGVYIGARMQRHVSPRMIKFVLVLALLWIAVQYIGGYFWQ